MVKTEEYRSGRAEPETLRLRSVRTVDGKTTVETRYYISSLPNNAEIFGQSVRSHWGIENSLHWILDVALNEDDCRIRKDNAPENFAVMRRLAVNLISSRKKQQARGEE